jgi:hypothetical protein
VKEAHFTSLSQSSFRSLVVVKFNQIIDDFAPKDMTYEDFVTKFKKTNSFEKYWNYFISIAVIGIGLSALFLLHFTDWHENKKALNENIMPVWGIDLSVGPLIFLGLYGFWRIPKTYKITSIKSDKTLAEKSNLINKIVAEFQFIILERKDQYYHFKYTGRFWTSFDIYCFYDAHNFYLNTQQIDSGNDGGFIDFGTSKRLNNKIKRKLLDKL